MAKRQLMPIRLSWLKNWRLLAKDPIHAVGLFFMKFCEFLAAGISIINHLFSKNFINKKPVKSTNIIRNETT